MAVSSETIKVGDRFRSSYADSNALWEVTRQLSPDSWQAEIVDEPYEHEGKTYPGDYAGQTAAFLGTQIRRGLLAARQAAAARQTSESFKDSLQIGQVIHYHQSFSQYVRGTIVATPKGKQFLPTALVGEWAPHELPHYDQSGEISAPYYAKHILEQTPSDIGNASNYYEAASFSGPHGPAAQLDPRELPEISLTPPPPTPEQTRGFALERLRQGAIRVLSETLDPGEALAAAQRLFFQPKTKGREL